MSRTPSSLSCTAAKNLHTQNGRAVSEVAVHVFTDDAIDLAKRLQRGSHAVDVRLCKLGRGIDEVAGTRANETWQQTPAAVPVSSSTSAGAAGAAELGGSTPHAV